MILYIPKNVSIIGVNKVEYKISSEENAPFPFNMNEQKEQNFNAQIHTGVCTLIH